MANRTEPQLASPVICPDCRMGTARPRLVFFCSWMDGIFLSVPNFPAWICDVCGFREYDGAALHELQTVVRGRSRVSGLPRRQRRALEPTEVHGGN